MPTGQDPNEPYQPGSYTYGLDYDRSDDAEVWADPPEPEPPYDPVDDPIGDPTEEAYEAMIRAGIIDPHTAEKPRRQR